MGLHGYWISSPGCLFVERRLKELRLQYQSLLVVNRCQAIHGGGGRVFCQTAFPMSVRMVNGFGVSWVLSSWTIFLFLSYPGCLPET